MEKHTKAETNKAIEAALTRSGLSAFLVDTQGVRFLNPFAEVFDLAILTPANRNGSSGAKCGCIKPERARALPSPRFENM